jgi:hypothetical protein
MEVAELFKDIVTFGAAGRVEAAEKRYESIVDEYQRLEGRVEVRRAEAESTFKLLVEEKQACVIELARLREISRNLSAREREFSAEAVREQPPSIGLARIESTLTAADAAKSAAHGAVAGASTAMGAWALAGAFANASTGAAIANLSGAAAQSATLAFFGGGSLAAGGFGVAGGAAALSAIVALPALAVMAAFSHNRANKDIARFEEESVKIQDAMDAYLKLELLIQLSERRASELHRVLGKARDAFVHQYNATYQRLFRWAWLSKAWRWLRRLFGGSYFKAHEVVEVQELIQVAAAFAQLIDQRVFEPDGSVKETTS